MNQIAVPANTRLILLPSFTGSIHRKPCRLLRLFKLCRRFVNRMHIGNNTKRLASFTALAATVADGDENFTDGVYPPLCGLLVSLVEF